MIDKIYYDVKFTYYADINKNFKSYLKKLKEEGINTVGIQSNEIGSFTMQKLLFLAKEEKFNVYRLFFNTEKELAEKIFKIK